MTVELVKLGLIGAGRIGRLHAAHLTSRIPTAQLMIVADNSVEAARQCAERNGIPTSVQDYRAVLNHPALHAVVICSPTDTHAQLIQEAAAAGKHVFCEKPLALCLSDIDRAVVAVERAGVQLQVGFNRRFDANSRRVLQAVEQGEIGQPHRLHLISRDPAPPPLDYIKVSGGIFMDMTIHDFDLARFLLDSEVEEIRTTAAVLVDPAIGAAGDLDTALVVLRFRNGAIGSIDNSRQAVYGYDQRVEVFGSRGAIRTENNYPNTALLSDVHSVRRDLPLHFFLERYAESYVTEMTAFVEAIRQDKPVPVNGRDGRMAAVMALAARRSHDENRAVRLSEILGPDMG
jgi:myo-inositol 2-dehydrogenase/D-chiro-inositol 1-dehydrogenase